MDDKTPLWNDGTVLEVAYSIKAGSKNPHGEWNIKNGVMRVDVTGLTRKDIVADLMGAWKIKRQRCRETMSRDDAYECMNRVVHWTEVGKVAQQIDVEAAYKAKFANMTDKEQEEHIAMLTAMQKAGMGGSR